MGVRFTPGIKGCEQRVERCFWRIKITSLDERLLPKILNSSVLGSQSELYHMCKKTQSLYFLRQNKFVYKSVCLYLICPVSNWQTDVWDDSLCNGKTEASYWSSFSVVLLLKVSDSLGLSALPIWTGSRPSPQGHSGEAWTALWPPGEPCACHSCGDKRFGGTKKSDWTPHQRTACSLKTNRKQRWQEMAWISLNSNNFRTRQQCGRNWISFQSGKEVLLPAQRTGDNTHSSTELTVCLTRLLQKIMWNIERQSLTWTGWHLSYCYWGLKELAKCKKCTNVTTDRLCFGRVLNSAETLLTCLLNDALWLPQMIPGSKTSQHQSPDMLHTSVHLYQFQPSLPPYLIWGPCSSFRYHRHPSQPSWQLGNDFWISFHFPVMLMDELVLQLLALEVPALPTINDNSLISLHDVIITAPPLLVPFLEGRAYAAMLVLMSWSAPHL